MNRRKDEGLIVELAVFISVTSQEFLQQNAEDFSLVSCNSAFAGNITTAVVINNFTDLEEFLNSIEQKVVQFIQQQAQKNLKTYSLLTAKFKIRDEEYTYYLYTKTQEISRTTNFHECFKKCVIRELLHRLSSLENGPSNATL